MDRSRLIIYNRETLIEVLITHQRMDSRACLCGWDELGRSHSEHVANEYEKAMIIRSN